MKSFNFHKPRSLKEALSILKENNGKAKLMAGGTDLLGEMKEKVTQPEQVIYIKEIPDLKYIRTGEDGLQIGALVSLQEITVHPIIQKKFNLLAQAAQEVGSPQLRNMGTLGGNLCQRPRCWYYRGDFVCLKKGGGQCYAVTGQNKYHAILEGGPCFIVHPSDTATALVALEARVKIASLERKKTIPLDKFFILPRQDISRENILEPDEILTEILIPYHQEGSRGVYLKARERKCWDFALASVAAICVIKEGICHDVRLVLGGIAPIPLRAHRAEELLRGKSLKTKLIEQASQLALSGARPLSSNLYKVELIQALVKQALIKFQRENIKEQA
jgi:xanthine dehydrogenase YagS FAD-binding subunit